MIGRTNDLTKTEITSLNIFINVLDQVKFFRVLDVRVKCSIKLCFDLLISIYLLELKTLLAESQVTLQRKDGSFTMVPLIALSDQVCTTEKGIITGSRSTFEFQGRVNLSGPSVYCIARTLGK